MLGRLELGVQEDLPNPTFLNESAIQTLSFALSSSSVGHLLEPAIIVAVTHDQTR